MDDLCLLGGVGVEGGRAVGLQFLFASFRFAVSLLFYFFCLCSLPYDDEVHQVFVLFYGFIICFLLHFYTIAYCVHLFDALLYDFRCCAREKLSECASFQCHKVTFIVCDNSYFVEIRDGFIVGVVTYGNWEFPI